MYLSLLTLFLFVSYTEPCEEADYVVCYDVPWGEADIVDRVWCTIKCKMTECRSSWLTQAYCVTGFLILSTVDILGLITLSCGGCSVYYRMFRSILDPKPLGPCWIPPQSCDHQESFLRLSNVSRRAKSSPSLTVLNSCWETLMYMITFKMLKEKLL